LNIWVVLFVLVIKPKPQYEELIMNMNTMKLLALPILITLTLSTVAQGNKGNKSKNGARRGPPPFCVMDINADGAITEAEYNEFKALKAAQGGRKGPPAFCMFDSNKDGSVTLEEFKKNSRTRFDHETIFNEIDKDADGFISEQELTEHKPMRRSNRKNNRRN